MRRLGVVLGLVVTLVFGASLPAAAEPGDFDSEFGNCGLAFPGDRPDAVTSGFALLPNGKALELRDSTAWTSPRLFRYRKDGSTDPTFGIGGAVEIAGMVTAGRGAFMARGVDGAITIVGHAPDRFHPTGSIVRLLANGARDQSFAAGSVTALVDSDPFGLVVLPSRSAIVVSPGTPRAIVRLDPSGSIDAGFRSDLITQMIQPYRIRTHLDGSFLVNGRWVQTPTGAPEWGIARFDEGGNPDPNFSLDQNLGGAEIGFNDFEFSSDSAGNIVVVRPLTVLNGYVVSRHLPTGAFDPAFNGNGFRVVNSTTTRFARDPVLETNGAITLLESRYIPSLQAFVPVVRRFGPTGTNDRAFGENGSSGLWSGSPAFSLALRAMPDAIEYWGTAFTSVEYLVRFKVRLDRLKTGAGIMLQWNGVGWPTRFGTDPPPQCTFDAPYWADTDTARGISTVRGKGAYIVDRFGGIHPFSIDFQRIAPAPTLGGPYWPGWDIARGIAAKRNGTGGYVLDAYGALHPFHTATSPQPAKAIQGPYWPGWDITRGVALMPDGHRGYILDGFGGIHRFTTPGRSLPPKLNHVAYWPGWDIARGISILGDGSGGYVVDGFGGVHPFGIGTHAPPPRPGRGSPYVPGVDWVRGFSFVDPIAPAAAAAASRQSPSTGSVDARIAIARRRGPTPVGPVSP